MSSSPFALGIPVVDHLPLTDGSYVLRADTRDQLYKRIARYQEMITPEDRIIVSDIGYRPDRPVPVRKFFAEVRVIIGPSELRYDHYMWHVFPGKRRARMIY